MKIKDKYFGAGSLFTAGFIYGFFGILTRTLGFNLPLFFQSWTRNLTGALILLIPLIVFNKWKKLKIKDVKWIIFRAIGGSIFGFIGFYIATYFIPIGTAYFVFFSGLIIGGYILGRILFDEKLTKVKTLSLILSVGGLCFIYTFNFKTENTVYILTALLSGLGTAVWNVFSKKISRTHSALQLNFLDFLSGFIITFFISILLKEQWSLPKISSPWITSLLFLGMFLSTGQLVIYGFKHLKAQTGSIIMLSEILFGITFAFLFYREIPSFTSFLGGILIVSAILLPALKFRSDLKK